MPGGIGVCILFQVGWKPFEGVRREMLCLIYRSLAAVGEWITAGARGEAATSKEVTGAIQRHTDDSLDSSGGTGDGGEVATFGLHFGNRVDGIYL